MSEKILVSARHLHAALESDGCLVVDCRFQLTDPGAGRRAYLEAHLPGAVYADLDQDLAGPVTGSSGRHPLPDANRFAAFLARSGWEPGRHLVAYDDAGGAIAARLWWLMRYFGQDAAALLDGGIQAWFAAGYPTESGPVETVHRPVARLTGRGDRVVSTAQVAAGLSRGDMVLVDARAAERYAGKVEPIDTAAGHVPGALNYPFSSNLAAGGRFKPAQEVRSGLLALTAERAGAQVVHMCGSGVTACHNIFAAELAGLGPQRLYVGSWSEWIRDPSRPVETTG